MRTSTGLLLLPYCGPYMLKKAQSYLGGSYTLPSTPSRGLGAHWQPGESAPVPLSAPSLSPLVLAKILRFDGTLLLYFSRPSDRRQVCEAAPPGDWRP